MRLRTGLAGVFVVSFLFAAGSAGAADLGYPANFAPQPVPAPQSQFFFLSEVRLGTFAHDPTSPEQGSADLNGEILFAKPFSAPGSAWDFLLPRPSVGATINFAGKTSQAYAGLTWTYDITRSIFVEGSFGGSVNNGKTGAFVPTGRSALGCNASFRESGSVGYRFTENWSLMGTIEHMSNAGLCSQIAASPITARASAILSEAALTFATVGSRFTRPSIASFRKKTGDRPTGKWTRLARPLFI